MEILLNLEWQRRAAQRRSFFGKAVKKLCPRITKGQGFGNLKFESRGDIGAK
jgi:hypothetical protein